jgi:predicted transporter
MKTNTSIAITALIIWLVVVVLSLTNNISIEWHDELDKWHDILLWILIAIMLVINGLHQIKEK